jgi:tetratricopeptide (TPR) repeat protein
LSLATGYARACHQAGDHQTARRLLATADALAPQNVERLCLLGEVDLCMRRPETARRRFLAALAIDANARKARAGAFVAESAMEPDAAFVDAAQRLPFASYLNLIGIDLSRAGNLQHAARYYKAAMVFVRNPDDLVKLWFNLGLCYLRGRSAAEAGAAFARAHALSGGTFERVAKYLRGDQGLPADGGAPDDIPFEKL